MSTGSTLNGVVGSRAGERCTEQGDGSRRAQQRPHSVTLESVANELCSLPRQGGMAQHHAACRWQVPPASAIGVARG
eukprot:CAMPEP_0119420770 /NCGR_PEP_ID=MMETSP1335-20130426/24272_1 /TAXON_ID=259385 /ORGANISM="Chrysoculter rhomboideus, Strain RCC1486" /LENGTH=76 /DNA_ID=CAMNT_0007446147 /DNA_START=426 /DNA_END=652 /DNA_ORIENTATION=+